MDESGHDHKTMPYEVRGGVAFHARKLWPFVQAVQRLELSAFGGELAQFKKASELKGAKLLDKDRYKWAAQDDWMDPEARRKHSRGFMTKGLEKKPPTREEFTAYGQACLEMARGIFQLLLDYDAVLFAAAIPCGSKPDPDDPLREFLRKDHVFLLERFFYFLEREQEHGLLVMDETEKTADRRFVRRLHSYFVKTEKGRSRTQWIVPSPLFVSSDMTAAVQAADLAIYCVNWGFRLPTRGMSAEVRQEIASEFGPLIGRLQFVGDGYSEGKVFKSFGVVFEPEPYPKAAK